MTLTETKKLSKHIFRLLKTNEITIPIGRTPKGNLGITFNENNDDFQIMLDSVPLSTSSVLDDENNIELKKMIEKYLFTDQTSSTTRSIEGIRTEFKTVYLPTDISKKKAGRPKGSKNGNTQTKKGS